MESRPDHRLLVACFTGIRAFPNANALSQLGDDHVDFVIYLS
jgi:hypothetical protein